MRRPNPRPVRTPAGLVELESRTLFASPTLAALPNVTVLSGAPLQIPLDGNDADAADALTFTVSSNNANVVPTISPATNRSLKIVVNHTASATAGDVSITNETMILKLFEDKAPNTTARIIALANAGFYNGLVFHRVINNFMIQGGDGTGTPAAGSAVSFDDEFNPALQFTGKGLLAMAKSYDDTNDSQFFITESLPRYLDFNHTIFGQLVEGEATREKISNLPTTTGDRPVNPVTMTSVTVIPDKQNGVLSLSVPNGVTSGTATITVTAKDPAGNSAVRTFTVTIGPDTQNDPPILGPIANLTTTANTSVTFQIPATDVDSAASTTKYFNWVGLYNNFSSTQGVPVVPPDDLPPESPTRNVDVDVNFDTGLTKITPKNNLVGVFPIFVGAAETTAAFDSQIVPLFINPAAPTSVDLVTASDTGNSNTDNLTRLNNTSGKTLQFQVNGVLAGATVKVFDGNTVIGQAVVAAGQTSVVVTTNATATLSNGAHTITATQTLANYAWHVGNQSDTDDLASTKSLGLTVNVDATVPGLASTPFTTAHVVKQSATFQFTEDVGPTLDPSDVHVVRAPYTPQEVPTEVPTANISVAWDAATKRAVITFPGFQYGTLPFGSYTISLVNAGIADPAGNAMTSSLAPTLISLPGDANIDLKVDFNDLVVVAQNYNTFGGKTYAQGDLTGDANVDFNDLVVLAQTYNKSFPIGADPVGAAVASASMTFDQAWAQAQSTTTPTKKNDNKSLFSITKVAKPVPAKRPAPRR